jgi:CheY-like chemotaxis protein
VRVLVVEDCEERIKGFIARRPADAELHISTSGREAMLALNEQRCDLVFLDHDLSFEAGIGRPAPGEISGYDVARKIGEMPTDRRPSMVVVHSWNPEGARRICAALIEAGVRHAREPYSEFVYVLWRMWLPKEGT